jgi:hypothetical protein
MDRRSSAQSHPRIVASRHNPANGRSGVSMGNVGSFRASRSRLEARYTAADKHLVRVKGSAVGRAMGGRFLLNFESAK